MSKFNYQLRREQLITPFGTGAMSVLPDGTSIVVGGLDHWFPDDLKLDMNEFEIDDWRLASRLGVRHLYSPPHIQNSGTYSFQRGSGSKTRIPVLRFPTWYFCKDFRCRRMEQRELDFIGRLDCPDPIHAAGKYRAPAMFQVPFVSMCESGHLNDFPWKQWVHRSVDPTCEGVIRFSPSGNSNPQGTRVSCDKCKSSRNLDRISSEINGRSFLSTTLEAGKIFICEGKRPWLGGKAQEICNKDIRGSFRGASNLYFSMVETSLYIPSDTQNISSELLELLSRGNLVAAKVLSKGDPKQAAALARSIDEQLGGYLKPFSDSEIESAYVEILIPSQPRNRISGQTREEYLRMEFELFQKELKNDRLRIQEPSGKYGDIIQSYFSAIKLVPILVETTALWGFSRVQSKPHMTFDEGRSMLVLNPSKAFSHGSWLPAKQNFGEGIFIQFDEHKLNEWESSQEVIKRFQKFTQDTFTDSFMSLNLTPRYALLHTFSHLLIKQLVFYCGYSQASLKERLYVSEGPPSMAGILIYTASGDSEGTLGGLVRMGNPGLLEQIMEQALREAEWCSNDPICSESSDFTEEGESFNRLSACYACALIPETACESFNLFLDRSLVVSNGLTENVSFFQLR